MAIVERIRAALIGVPVSPPGELIARYPDLAEVQYRRGGLPTLVGGWCLGTRAVAGITLWGTVFLASEVAFSAELLLHELAHVRQFQASRAFPFQYLWESIRVGYRRNRFEVAARRFAAQRLRASVVLPPPSGK